MDLIDQLKALSSKVAKQSDIIQSEEATKNAFIMPFISALGYNVFDPTEVTPELNADVGTKKGEKVDYAILKDGKPIILIECKWCKADLDQEHVSQLYRYFTVTEARFGVLTNGIIYRFYTDLEEPNKMDAKPFLEFNILDIKDSTVEDLKKFTKAFFNLEETLTAATELKYTKEIKRIIAEQFANPTDDFVKFFASQVYAGKLTQVVKQQFMDLTKRALHQFVNDRLNERLKSALTEEITVPNTTPVDQTLAAPSPTDEKEAASKIVTTEDELEGYHIVKAILSQQIDPKRVVIRDTINYCNIVLDDSRNKTICRFYFNNPSKKMLGLFDADRKEEKYSISVLTDIYQYAEKIKSTATSLDKR
jgi:predicted type IV restriction endonuclease